MKCIASWLLLCLFLWNEKRLVSNSTEISETSWVIGASSCGGHCASSNSPEHIEVSVNGKIVYDGSDIGFHFVQIGRNTGEVVDSKVWPNLDKNDPDNLCISYLKFLHQLNSVRMKEK